ncbi:MAG: hypothetical protein AAF585_22860 [Verrucomicrobiota bacterium]
MRDSFRTHVQKAFQSNSNLKKLCLVGHSLGGALAQIAAVDTVLTTPAMSGVPTPDVITFGAPMVGDSDWAALFAQSVGQVVNLAMANDWVPTIPNHGRLDGSTTNLTSFSKVTGIEVIPAGTRFPLSHFISNYYSRLQLLYPNTTATDRSSTPLTELVLEIKTGDVIFSGTDASVTVNLLGVDWPLPATTTIYSQKRGKNVERDNFERFHSEKFTLFSADQPTSKLSNPTVGDLNNTEVVLKLGTNKNDAWLRVWMKIYVNGEAKPFVQLTWNKWMSKGDAYGAQIGAASS